MRKKLALFFSFRISLKEWHDLGLLEREVKLYNRLSNYFDRIYFFTYGGKEDKKFSKYLSSNIDIIPIPGIDRGGKKKGLIPLMYIYSVLIPLIHWKIFKRVDILKTNQLPGAWSAVITKLLFGKKMILRCGYVWSCFAKRNRENSIRIYIKKILERISCVFADNIVCSSDADRVYLKYNYGVKAQVLPNYVNTELFMPGKGVSKVKNSVCFVGRLEKQKNLIALLDAVKGLSCKLTLIGSGSMEGFLKDKAHKEKIDVGFIGNVSHSDLPGILNQQEVFILPSLYEGTPKVLLEAMACGLPVIGTDVAGIKEIIEHQRDGYLCLPSAESIREAVIVLFQEEALRKILGSGARKKISEKFSLERILEQELNLYQSMEV